MTTTKLQVMYEMVMLGESTIDTLPIQQIRKQWNQIEPKRRKQT